MSLVEKGDHGVPLGFFGEDTLLRPGGYSGRLVGPVHRDNRAPDNPRVAQTPTSVIVTCIFRLRSKERSKVK